MVLFSWELIRLHLLIPWDLYTIPVLNVSAPSFLPNSGEKYNFEDSILYHLYILTCLCLNESNYIYFPTF